MNGFQPTSIEFRNGCDFSFTFGNEMSGFIDLYTRSIIVNQDHTGNIFGAERAIGEFISPQAAAASVFTVDQIENNGLFFPNFHTSGLFEVDNDNLPTDQCLQNAGVPSPRISNPEEELCELLSSYIDNIDNNVMKNTTCIHLTDLITGVYLNFESQKIPDCVNEVLMSMEYSDIYETTKTNIFLENHRSQLSEELLYIDVLNSMKNNAYKSWLVYDVNVSGNSFEEKESLWADYILIIENINQKYVDIEQMDEDFWLQLNSIDVSNFTDSVSMLQIQGLQMSQKDELNQEELNLVLFNSELCADQYGKGVHTFRGIASIYNDTDYRIFDNCFEPVEEFYKELAADKIGIQVFPNPAEKLLNVVFEQRENYRFEQKLKCRLTSVLGQIACEANLNRLGTSINIENLGTGIYYLEILEDDKLIEIRKIFVE